MPGRSKVHMIISCPISGVLVSLLGFAEQNGSQSAQFNAWDFRSNAIQNRCPSGGNFRCYVISGRPAAPWGVSIMTWPLQLWQGDRKWKGFSNGFISFITNNFKIRKTNVPDKIGFDEDRYSEISSCGGWPVHSVWVVRASNRSAGCCWILNEMAERMIRAYSRIAMNNRNWNMKLKTLIQKLLRKIEICCYAVMEDRWTPRIWASQTGLTKRTRKAWAIFYLAVKKVFADRRGTVGGSIRLQVHSSRYFLWWYCLSRLPHTLLTRIEPGKRSLLHRKIHSD